MSVGIFFLVVVIYEKNISFVLSIFMFRFKKSEKWYFECNLVEILTAHYPNKHQAAFLN